MILRDKCAGVSKLYNFIFDTTKNLQGYFALYFIYQARLMFDHAYNTKSNTFYHMFKGMKSHSKFNQDTWEKHLLILN